MVLKQKSPAASAEMIGIKAIGFLVSSEDDLTRFMGSSGLAPDELRDRAEEPEILVAVLDHILGEDALLTAFCEAEGLTPRMVHIAQHELSGG